MKYPDQPGNNMRDVGLVKCTREQTLYWLDFAAKRIENGLDSFGQLTLPLRSRANTALLGAYPSHGRNFEYNKLHSLQELIEKKTNRSEGRKAIIAVNSPRSLYVFETIEFSYRQLQELHSLTFATDFLLLLLAKDAVFVFYEDDPACIMSYANELDFSADFMTVERSNEIFSNRMLDWKISDLPSQQKWLESILTYLHRK